MRNQKLTFDPVSTHPSGNANYYLSLRYLFLRIEFLNKRRLMPGAA